MKPQAPLQQLKNWREKQLQQELIVRLKLPHHGTHFPNRPITMFVEQIPLLTTVYPTTFPNILKIKSWKIAFQTKNVYLEIKAGP